MIYDKNLSLFYVEDSFHYDYMAALLKGIDPNAQLVSSKDGSSVVIWGWRHGCKLARNGKNVLIMERGYLGDRSEWTSLGWNGLNGYAKFYNDDVPNDRWVKYWKSGMKPWRGDAGGDYVLFCGQVISDQSLSDCPDYQFFVQEQLYKLRLTYGRVLFRPHPLMNRSADYYINIPKGIEVIDPTKTTITEDIEKARFVVAWSSNSLVDAMYHGVPFISHSRGSMVHTYQKENMFDEPDRETWGRRISYCQWTKEELANGTAWKHAKIGLNPPPII